MNSKVLDQGTSVRGTERQCVGSHARARRDVCGGAPSPKPTHDLKSPTVGSCRSWVRTPGPRKRSAFICKVGRDIASWTLRAFSRP